MMMMMMMMVSLFKNKIKLSLFLSLSLSPSHHERGLHNNKLINTELSKKTKKRFSVCAFFWFWVHLNSTLFTHVIKTALNFDPPKNNLTHFFYSSHSRLHQSPLLEKRVSEVTQKLKKTPSTLPPSACH
jgi:hypothetical protein